MFWKKKEAAVKPTEAKAEPPKAKEKKLSPKDIIVRKIEQLSPEQTISYRLPETYGGGLVIVELNPEYPAKGRKYILSTEKIASGKPTGQRSRLWDSNKPKDMAGWIIDRGGELFGSTEEGAISS